MYALPLIDNFKASISKDTTLNKKNSYVRSFKTFLDKYLISHGFISFCGNKKLGKVYFNKSIHSHDALPHIYALLVEKYANEKEAKKQQQEVTTKDIHILLKEQCSNFLLRPNLTTEP